MCVCVRPLAVSLPLSQLAQPIRLLLKFTGTDFEDVRYEFGPGNVCNETHPPLQISLLKYLHAFWFPRSTRL